ncbi:MAG: hypothetical protein LJE62_17090, partial [Silicimonas sp.]|nr:hypothetical protein [Silicimonas sp.]
MIDVWNPETFDAELKSLMGANSDLTTEYWRLHRQLMDDHLNSNPYESLKPNPLSVEYLRLQEQEVSPLLGIRKIRVWHYTRLLDEEVEEMKRALCLSTLDGLKKRLNILISLGHLAESEAATVYNQSPFQTQDVRSNKLYAVTAPLPISDCG